MSEEDVLFGCSWKLLYDLKEGSDCLVQRKAPLLRSNTCHLACFSLPQTILEKELSGG